MELKSRSQKVKTSPKKSLQTDGRGLIVSVKVMFGNAPAPLRKSRAKHCQTLLETTFIPNICGILIIHILDYHLNENNMVFSLAENSRSTMSKTNKSQKVTTHTLHNSMPTSNLLAI